MTVEPIAVAVAGEREGKEVLPEGVVRITSKLTATAPTEGLLPISRHLPTIVLVLDRGGSLYWTSDYVEEAESLRFTYYMASVRAVHGFRGSPDVDLVQCLNAIIQDSPWRSHDWFRENIARWAEHLPAPSERVPGLLAYYQSPEKRARNIRTPIKPGKYLKKFFGDLLSEEAIREHALTWQNYYALRPLTVTQDADEIETVYKGAYNGSCMHFPSNEHLGDVHPARAYAGPDLGVAYIGDAERCDGRCLVWPEKKIYFPKFYGDRHRLEAALRAEGYRAGEAREFRGARLRRIPHRNSAFVVPYVDVCEAAEDDGTYLVLGGGDVYLRNTSGISNERQPCAECEEYVGEEDLTTVWNGDRVCSHCLENEYFYCEGSEEYYPNARRADTPEGYSVSKRYAARSSDWFYCSHTGLYYPHSDFEEVELMDGDTCVRSYAEENGFYCEHAEAWSLDLDTKVELSNGMTVSRGSFTDDPDLTGFLARHDATIVGRDEHPDQLELAVAA